MQIGAHCNISAGTHIYSHSTVERVLTGGKSPITLEAVRVGDMTYIGPQVIISAGVTVGSRCVVGTNSFVKDDIPDNSIPVGSPARIVGHVQVDESNNVEFVYGQQTS